MGFRATLTALIAAALLAACAAAPEVSKAAGPVATAVKSPSSGRQAGLPVGGADPNSPDALTREDMERFLNVVDRMEPVAEAYCRRFGERSAGARSCNIQIAVDANPYQPPNAFQTLDGAGRPVVVFTLALIAQTRSEDELAFVMGHEAGHHIAGHIPARQQTALRGAMMAGMVAAAAGGGAAEVEAAQRLGAETAARRYSKEYELEADRIGTQIAFAAGYDPLLGAQFFNRLPDPGDQFQGSHPANAERQAVVVQTVAELTAP
jgi:predicted Zn-dependent protease